jgi:hypothetical protein
MGGLVHRDEREPPEQEDQRAEADLARHDERGAIAADHEIREDRQARGHEQRDRGKRRRGEEPPPPAPVQPVEEPARAGPGDLLRRHEPSRERPIRGRRPGHTGQQAPLGELGHEPREPGGASLPLASLGLADELGERSPTIEQLQQRRIGVRQPNEPIRVEVPEHPPLLALSRVEPLERVPRTQHRVRAERRRVGYRALLAVPHHHRAARLGLTAPALNDQLLVADPDPRAVAQRCPPFDAAPVEPRPVARPGVFEQHLA